MKWKHTKPKTKTDQMCQHDCFYRSSVAKFFSALFPHVPFNQKTYESKIHSFHKEDKRNLFYLEIVKIQWNWFFRIYFWFFRLFIRTNSRKNVSRCDMYLCTNWFVCCCCFFFLYRIVLYILFSCWMPWVLISMSYVCGVVEFSLIILYQCIYTFSKHRNT